MDLITALNLLNGTARGYLILRNKFYVNGEYRFSTCTEYMITLNPCWWSEVKFFENGKEIARVPLKILTSDEWEFVEV